MTKRLILLEMLFFAFSKILKFELSKILGSEQKANSLNKS